MSVLGFKRNVIVDNTSVTEKVEERKKRSNTRNSYIGTPEAIALGKHIRELRKAIGLKMAEVSTLLGVNACTWNHYELGGGVLPAVLVKPLCEVLGVSVSELFDYVVPKEEPKEEEPKSADDRIAALEAMVAQLLDERRKGN